MLSVYFACIVKGPSLLISLHSTVELLATTLGREHYRKTTLVLSSQYLSSTPTTTPNVCMRTHLVLAAGAEKGISC
jgi:hypothetical protein